MVPQADRSIIDQRIERIRANLLELRKMAKIPKDQFLADRGHIAASERLLQVSIEAALDIGSHIIAVEGFEAPNEYRDVFSTLGKHGLFSRELTKRLEEMVGLRNRLVHVYLDVDPTKIHEYINQNLDDFDECIRCILKFIV